MSIQCLVTDLYGRGAIEIAAQIEYIAWRLNRLDQARFSLPYTDANCLPEILRLSNRVLFRFDNGLPDWAGVIDVPRRRGRDGVTVTAYGAERLLSWRRTGLSESYSAVAGEVADALLDAANERWPTGLVPGAIDDAGSTRSEEYHYHDLKLVLDRLRELAGHDYRVAATYIDGQLSFSLGWYELLGDDRTDEVALLEGRNAHDVVIDEQGPIASEVIVVGGDGGTTWDTKPVSRANDLSSRNATGYREHVEVLSGVTDQTTLDESAASLGAAKGSVRRSIRLVALDAEPACFCHYDVGDRVQLQAHINHQYWAYDGPVRIKAREWMPSGVCRLEVEEWTES